MFFLFDAINITSSPWQALRLLCWYVILQAQKRLLSTHAPECELSLLCKQGEKQFGFELRTILDLHVLREVFSSNEYAINPHAEPRYILDIGANIGASLVYLALQFPKANIAAFEPNPSCSAHLRKNAAQFGTRVQIFQEAIAQANGELTFYKNAEHWGGSLIKRTEGGSLTVQAIAAKTLKEHLGWPHIDLLKIDIEGGEYAIAEDLAELAPEHIIAEVHPDITHIPYSTFLSAFAKNYTETMVYRHGERVVVHLTRTYP